MSRSRSALPPYLTSGAASRAHHALLVKLHDAASDQEQEDILAAEVRRIKLALSTKDASMSKVSEHLLVLLHIASMRKRMGEDLEFALVPALQLAEGGKTIKERRLGYLFLTERLPLGHELNLLLVNTIRKDLASQKPSDILLALHTIVKLPAPELSPAVTPILVSSALLKHPEAAVRQRTLQALQALHIDAARSQTGAAGRSDLRPTFPLSMSKVTRLLGKEQDASVAAAIFRLMSRMIKTGAHTIASEEERLFLVDQVDRTLDRLALGPGRQLARDAINCLSILVHGASDDTRVTASDTLMGLLHPAPGAKATLLEICRLAFVVSSEKLTGALFARVRSLLAFGPSDPDAPSSSDSTHVATSRPKPNDHMLALRCLDALKKVSWAGRLGEEDMAAVMEGINSPDDTIRRATLRLLHEADPSLTRSTLQSHIDSLKNASDLFLPLGIPADSSVEQKTRAGIDETARRCLEVAEIRMKGDLAFGALQSEEIGIAYASDVAETLDAWTEAQQVTGDPGYQVWDDGVAIVMGLLRDVPDMLSSAAARRLLVGAEGAKTERLSPTQQVLGCETCAAFAGHHEPNAGEMISAVLAVASSTSGLIKDQGLVAAFTVLLDSTEGARDRLAQEMLSRLDSERNGNSHRNSRRSDQLRFLLEQNLLDKVSEESSGRALADLALAIDSVYARESAARHRKAEKGPEREEAKDWSTRPRDLTASQLRYDAYVAPSV